MCTGVMNLCTEGLNSLVVQVLICVCDMQTYVNKKAYIRKNLRVHTRNEARSPEKDVFLDTSNGPG
jgi:hypothetical protein